MKILFFEHWVKGQFDSILYVKNQSIRKAIEILSENYKGVFRRIHDKNCNGYKRILKNYDLMKGK